MISLQRKLIGGIAQIGLRNITTTRALEKTYYDTLGISRNATQADIKNAYFELSKLYHPDRIAATDENLAKFREISDAYEILGNEQSRKLYDRGLLGGIKKPLEEADDVSDPIIKFYQKRQDLSKSLTQSFPQESTNEYTWSQKFFKDSALKSEIRKKMVHKVTQEAFEVQEHPGRNLFACVIITITLILFSTNFENSRPEILWRRIFGH